MTNKEEDKKVKKYSIQTASAILKDGTLVEMLYDRVNNHTDFTVFKNGQLERKTSIKIDENVVLIPYGPNNGLLKNNVVLFPNKAENFGSENDLIAHIQTFIHKYLDISPFFEKIATYYTMFSWIYDCFNELPYLRALGDYGCGKTRFLQVIGSICYKPIFAGGATTTSPIFRILNDIRGTLILDEADFRFSDTKSEIIKILNNGFAKGFPVLRSEGNNDGKWSIKSFDVFGPKVIGNRERFQDKALESRFLVEEMDKGSLREDIPLNIPDSFWDEATQIRNKLLTWRFLNFGKKNLDNKMADKSIQPRLSQIMLPLLSIIKDEEVVNDLKAMLINYNKQIASDRGMEMDARIFEKILMLLQHYSLSEITVKNIADPYNTDLIDPKETVSYSKMGWFLRERLKLKTERSRDGYVLSESNKDRIELLKKKFGITNEFESNEIRSEDIPTINEPEQGKLVK